MTAPGLCSRSHCATGPPSPTYLLLSRLLSPFMLTALSSSDNLTLPSMKSLWDCGRCLWGTIPAIQPTPCLWTAVVEGSMQISENYVKCVLQLLSTSLPQASSKVQKMCRPKFRSSRNDRAVYPRGGHH